MTSASWGSTVAAVGSVVWTHHRCLREGPLSQVALCVSIVLLWRLTGGGEEDGFSIDCLLIPVERLED